VEGLGDFDIRAAARRIAGIGPSHAAAHLEPVRSGSTTRSRSSTCSSRPGRSRSVARLSLLTGVAVPPAGVVAASGGNFGLAVAWAAARARDPRRDRRARRPPRPTSSPLRGFDATLRVVDGYYADALAVAEDRTPRPGRSGPTPTTSGRSWRAGHGGCSRCSRTRGRHVLVACGGGGLLAGTIAAVGGAARVVAVETEGTATLHAALAAGHPVDIEVGGLAASSLGAARLGSLAWAAATASTARSSSRRRRPRRAAAVVGGHPAGRRAGRGDGAGGADERGLPAGPDERVAVLVCGANTDPATVVPLRGDGRPPGASLGAVPPGPPAPGTDAAVQGPTRRGRSDRTRR
jgi:threonine dehydratase